jgi:hypothetical protein
MNKEKDAQKQFISFCPDWKTVILHKEWQTYAKRCYGRGVTLFHFKNNIDQDIDTSLF